MTDLQGPSQQLGLALGGVLCRFHLKLFLSPSHPHWPPWSPASARSGLASAPTCISGMTSTPRSHRDHFFANYSPCSRLWCEALLRTSVLKWALFVCLFYFAFVPETESPHCNPDWPGTHCVAQINPWQLPACMPSL